MPADGMRSGGMDTARYGGAGPDDRENQPGTGGEGSSECELPDGRTRCDLGLRLRGLDSSGFR
jgi:hypothetical protein